MLERVRVRHDTEAAPSNHFHEGQYPIGVSLVSHAVERSYM